MHVVLVPGKESTISTRLLTLFVGDCDNTDGAIDGEEGSVFNDLSHTTEKISLSSNAGQRMRSCRSMSELEQQLLAQLEAANK